DAGVDRRHVRPAAYDRIRAHRSEMGDAGDERDRLRGRGNLLFRLLLRHVPLRAIHRGAARQERPALNRRENMSDTATQPTGGTPRPSTVPRMQTTTSDVAIEIAGMHKWYGEFHVLRDINLTVKRGERIVICGPSGSGKSTMIRCINRLEEHQQGR